MSNENTLHRLELRIAYLLRYGVMLAGAFMVAGWAWSLVTHGDRLGTFRVYAPVSLPVTWSQAWLAGDWGTIIALTGLGILVLLPVVRVLLTGVLFIKQGDRVLAILAFLVFAVLVMSFTLGIDL
jgi:uncharacterized membrane protein